MMSSKLNSILDDFYQSLATWGGQFDGSKFYCEQLWMRVSLHQDGRMEPCHCALSRREPMPPEPSVREVWNNPSFTQTRKFLLDHMEKPGQIPLAKDEVFDCCAGCPVAPLQRFNLPYLNYLLKKCVSQRFRKQPLLMLKKLTNLRKLTLAINQGEFPKNAYPVFANIDPTNVCNLRCVECDVGTGNHEHPRGQMKMDLYEKIMREIGPYLIHLDFFRYGEPLMHKNILKMIEMAEKKYAIHVRISTNFSMKFSEGFLRGLVKSGLSELVISADDVEQELYEQYRVGGDINLVIKNLENLNSIKKEMNSSTPTIGWQALMFKFNQNRKDVIEKKARELGADQFGFAPAFVSASNAHLQPTADKVREVKTDKKSQVVAARITPVSVSNDEPFTLEIDLVQNVFTEEIPVSSPDGGIRVGIKLADQEKNELGDFGRILFDKPFKPGEKITLTQQFSLSRNIDLEKLAYLKIDLVLEHQYWFEQNAEIQSQPYFLPIEFKNQPQGV